MKLKQKTQFDTEKIKKKVRKANIESLSGAGAYIRRVARNKIIQSPNSAPVGSAPHSRRGQLKKSLLFGVDRQRNSVVIGPAASLIGQSMVAHEYGGKYRKERYPRRPLMGPSLQQSRSRLPAMWADSVK